MVPPPPQNQSPLFVASLRGRRWGFGEGENLPKFRALPGDPSDNSEAGWASAARLPPQAREKSLLSPEQRVGPMGAQEVGSLLALSWPWWHPPP